MLSWNFTRRIFNSVARINSATIFTVIAPNAFVIGIIIYQIHKVSAIHHHYAAAREYRQRPEQCFGCGFSLISLFFWHFNLLFVFSQFAAAFDFDGVFYFIMTLFFILIWPYLFCYFADITTKRISNIQQSVYKLKWYNFPLNLQKHFILMMAYSQRPIYFAGLKFVRGTLATFGTVIMTIFFFSMLAAFCNCFFFCLTFAADQIIDLLLFGFWCNIKPRMIRRWLANGKM